MLNLWLMASVCVVEPVAVYMRDVVLEDHGAKVGWCAWCDVGV